VHYSPRWLQQIHLCVTVTAWQSTPLDRTLLVVTCPGEHAPAWLTRLRLVCVSLPHPLPPWLCSSLSLPLAAVRLPPPSPPALAVLLTLPSIGCCAPHSPFHWLLCSSLSLPLAAVLLTPPSIGCCAPHSPFLGLLLLAQARAQAAEERERARQEAAEVGREGGRVGVGVHMGLTLVVREGGVGLVLPFNCCQQLRHLLA
jgi:hypothetical protein